MDRSCDGFFEKLDRIALAVTYRDVKLKTAYAEVAPDGVNLHSKFSKHVELKLPIVSAAMDTVTEHEMAIAIARKGGLGVIHRNILIEDQVLEVKRVKNYMNALNGLVENPIVVYEDQTVASIMQMRKDNKYSFDSFPVLSRKDDSLVGIMTGHDLDFFRNDLLQRARDVMNPKGVVTATHDLSQDELYSLMKDNRIKVVPRVDDSGGITGLYSFSDIEKVRSGDSKEYNIDNRGHLRVGAAIGTTEGYMDDAEKLAKVGVDVLVIETAHANSKNVIDALKNLKGGFDMDVVAGNISEPGGAERLCNAGADGLKIGQGPGAICTTRKVAGIGCPQVTAIYNCSKVADDFDVPTCGDGGIVYSGDITIAIGAGAYSVMLGSKLARTKEAPGEIIIFEGMKWKTYRGMGSVEAMKAGPGASERYGQTASGKKAPEGVSGKVPYKGLTLEDALFYDEEGLRSGMGYTGAPFIQSLRKKADFNRNTDAGERESHAHDVDITHEAPNYQR